MFLQAIYRTTNALNKIQSMASIKLRVSVPWCHPQGICYNKGIHVQQANLEPYRPYWNDTTPRDTIHATSTRYSDFFSPVALRPNAGHGFTPHNAAQSVGFLWTSDQLIAETSTCNTHLSQQINIDASGGIRSHNLSRQAAENPRFIRRGHRDRLSDMYSPLHKTNSPF